MRFTSLLVLAFFLAVGGFFAPDASAQFTTTGFEDITGQPVPTGTFNSGANAPVSSDAGIWEAANSGASGGNAVPGTAAGSTGGFSTGTASNGNFLPTSSTGSANAAAFQAANAGGGAAGAAAAGGCNGQQIAGVCFPTGTGLSEAPVQDILVALASWLLTIVGIIALIAFVISGLQYLLASGDEGMIETAKRHMTWSIVGVVVALSGVVIIQAIDALLQGQSTF